MSIQVSNISKHYGKQEVLHNVNFTVKKGEIVSFLGPNGAGKSTCMKILTGWVIPDSGEVTICGYKMETNPVKAKYCIGYLPENNPLYPEMYVSEYLKYVTNIYHIPNFKKVKKVIDKLGLTEVYGKTIKTLSKGFRQRLGLAQALIHDPQVVILDEPFTGLDPNQLNEMYGLIKELGKEKAILFSSHALSEIKEICERTLILHQGKIVADFSLNELSQEKSLDEIFKELTYENNCR